MRQGTSLELAVCQSLVSMNICPDPNCIYTKNRMRMKFKSPIPSHLIHAVFKPLAGGRGRRGPIHFCLQKDVAGLSRSSDVVIHRGRQSIHVSIKSNNKSLKHPSVLNLPKQLGLCTKETAEFRSSLQSIYRRAYHQWSASHETLNTVSRLEKEKVYRQVNALVARQLRKVPIERVVHFLKFLLDPDTYVLCCKATSANLLRIAMPDVTSTSAKIKVRSHRNSFLLLGENGEVRLRLHTSKSALCENLALKYDVTVHNSLIKECAFPKWRSA